MTKKRTLEQLREEIDGIDRQLLELINARARLAQEVAGVKQADGQAKGEPAGFYCPDREAQILENIIAENKGPLSATETARLFREIMSACLALEQPLSIAYLGPEGTFTQTAALKHFGHSINTAALGSIDQVFREVESGDAHYGVVPVENSIEGVVNHTLDMLHHSTLTICGEVELGIHHHLLSKADSLTGIRTVYSHQQSLAQCRAWLDTHLMSADRVAVPSNAEAAQRACLKDTTAAIASETAGELYQLNALASNIEDESDNTTRFLVLGQARCPPCGNDKTSLLLSAPNKPGLLYKILSCFAENEVSLTRIESRPSRREVWDYVFFVDIEGHVEDPPVKQALIQLEECTAMLKLLGSYPRAVL